MDEGDATEKTDSRVCDRSNLSELWLSHGDCGVIMAKDGDWRIFQIPDDDLAQANEEQIKANMGKVTLLAFVLANPVVLNLVAGIMENVNKEEAGGVQPN